MSVGPGQRGKTIDIAKIVGMDTTRLRDKMAKQNVSFDTLEECPDPPDWLLPYDHAVAHWDAIAPLMVKHNLLTVANVYALALMCAAYHQLVTKFVENDAAFSSSQIALIPQYRGLISEFGLTPTSQMKAHAALGAAGGGAAGGDSSNAFAKNKRSA